MNAAKLPSRIAPEAGKMGGKPVIRGRRITPAMVLNMLANGASREAVLEAYPVLEPEDIDACLFYAARLGRRRIVCASLPTRTSLRRPRAHCGY
jgi:uncharacterized protein (DUF433 family)